ncbi:integral membrane nitrite extrusion protein NARU (nitrite facilitator) [Mycobacterium tuberculosis]|nr:integral membrane nitrite extrusion protein NARU (nitrite facilitator) [Mycobacterium tuberculosis]
MALTTAPAIDYALPRQQDEGDHWIDDWRPEPSTSASACGCCGASWLSR